MEWFIAFLGFVGAVIGAAFGPILTSRLTRSTRREDAFDDFSEGVLSLKGRTVGARLNRASLDDSWGRFETTSY